MTGSPSKSAYIEKWIWFGHGGLFNVFAFFAALVRRPASPQAGNPAELPADARAIASEAFVDRL